VKSRIYVASLRCSSVKYVEYSPSSRLGPLATAQFHSVPQPVRCSRWLVFIILFVSDSAFSDRQQATNDFNQVQTDFATGDCNPQRKCVDAACQSKVDRVNSETITADNSVIVGMDFFTVEAVLFRKLI
jgi:hypothetical protein